MPALKDFLTLLEWFCYGCLFLHIIIVLKLCCTWRREGHLSFFNHGFVSIFTHTNTNQMKDIKAPRNLICLRSPDFSTCSGCRYPPVPSWSIIIVTITSIIITIIIFITAPSRSITSSRLAGKAWMTQWTFTCHQRRCFLSDYTEENVVNQKLTILCR